MRVNDQGVVARDHHPVVGALPGFVVDVPVLQRRLRGLLAVVPLREVVHNIDMPQFAENARNLLAHPDAEVEIGTIMLPVKAALIEGEEWDAVFARLVAIYPGYALYLDRRGDLPPRLFRLIPQT